MTETKSVLVLGATRETGLETVQALRARARPVVGFARPQSDQADLRATGAPVVEGDAFERASLDAAFATHEIGAVVSSLGGSRGEPRRVDFEGSKNAIDAAKAAGVQRFIMVTMIGCGDSESAISPEARQAFATPLKLKTEAENYLISSGLDYTILRPGGMRSEPATGRGLLSEDHALMGVIHRADLARLILQCLDDPATVGRTYHTVDSEMTGMPKLQVPWAKPQGS